MIVIFYLRHLEPQSELFRDNELPQALKRTQELRADPLNSHVCISTELADSVGKSGVNEVADGKLPDGSVYDWSKKHRGEGPVQ